MQLADLGQIASYDKIEKSFILNQKLLDVVGPKVDNSKDRVCQYVFRQVASGISYLHTVIKMANRDIKPDNILFATKAHGTNPAFEDRAQIADFTTVIEIPNENYTVSDKAGTVAFMPPECFNHTKYKPKPMDIWALGVSIYCCFFGKLPFVGDTENEMVENIRNLEVKIPEECSDDLRQALISLLTKDPENRPSISEV